MITLFAAEDALKEMTNTAVTPGSPTTRSGIERPAAAQQLANPIDPFLHGPASSVGAARNIGTMTSFIAHAAFDT